MKTFHTVLTSFLVLSTAAFAEECTRTETIAISISPGDPVEIYNLYGDIRFEEWDSEDLELSYTITCDDQRAMDNLTIALDTGSGLSCSVEYEDEYRFFNDSSVDFVVKLPSGSHIELETAFMDGDIFLHGGLGSATLELVRGNIEVMDFDGELTAVLVTGDITVSGVPGLKQLDLVNGVIECDIASMLNDIEINTISGDVSLALSAMSRVAIETMSGDIRIADSFGAVVRDNYVGRSADFGGGDNKIEISTVSGDISVSD